MEGLSKSFMGKEDCCLCCSPKMGIFILSSLSIFFGVLKAIGAAVALALYETSYYRGGLFQSVIILWLIVEIQKIIIRSLLITGVRKNNYALMFPSLCWDFVFICTIIPSPFMMLSYLALPGGLIFLIFVGTNLIICLLIHWFLVEYHYYENLRSKNPAFSALSPGLGA